MNRTLTIIVAVVAAVVILVGAGIAVFVFMPTIIGATSSGSPTPTPTAFIVSNTSATPAPNKKPVNQYIRQYTPNVEQQLASGLKLTSDQLTTQLHSGKTLTQIATAQNVTGPQLDTVIANALQNGLQPAVTAGELTQKQVALLVKRFQKNPDQLGRVLIPQPHKNATATPQA
jgi:hypothetical protein